MTDASATLCLHAGGYRATREQINAVNTPPATATWLPVGHGNLLDILVEKMKSRNIVIDGDPSYALTKDGNQMFGTFKLKSEARADFALAMGVRNSINKTLSAGICCGTSVFACDNLAFTSDIVFFERHTPGILGALPQTIDRALDKFLVLGNEQEILYNRMKKIEVPLPVAIKLIRKMGEEEKILPQQQLYRVIDEFATPRFAEFKEYNAYNLMNACTTFCRHDRREVNPLKEQSNLMGITRVIAAHCGLSLTDASIN
jgi:hypothetical protein